MEFDHQIILALVLVSCEDSKFEYLDMLLLLSSFFSSRLSSGFYTEGGALKAVLCITFGTDFSLD